MERPAANSKLSWWSNLQESIAFWRAPVIAGASTGVGSWLV